MQMVSGSEVRAAINDSADLAPCDEQIGHVGFCGIRKWRSASSHEIYHDRPSTTSKVKTRLWILQIEKEKMRRKSTVLHVREI
jgi:hypothetical protein